MMEFINVRVDDYLPPIDSSKPEDPPIGSLHEGVNILNIPKDAPPSSDGGRDTVSTDVRIVPKGERPITKDIRTTNDTLQHYNNQDTTEQTDIST